MNTKIFFILFLLMGIFFATYGLIVESPFTASNLDFNAYVKGLMAISMDTSTFPVSRLAVTILIFVLARLAIWLVQKLLKV